MSEASTHRTETKAIKTKPSSGVAKVIELYAESPKGWEQAVQLCIAEAARTIRNITELQMDSFSVTVHDDAIQNYKVRCRISFSIDDAMRAH